MVAPILCQPRVLLAGGGAPEAGRVLEPGLGLGWHYLVERGAAGRFCGCCVRASCGIRGWSPPPHSASPAALPAPPCCAPARTKPNCLYLFVGSDDAGGGRGGG